MIKLLYTCHRFSQKNRNKTRTIMQAPLANIGQTVQISSGIVSTIMVWTKMNICAYHKCSYISPQTSSFSCPIEWQLKTEFFLTAFYYIPLWRLKYLVTKCFPFLNHRLIILVKTTVGILKLFSARLYVQMHFNSLRVTDAMAATAAAVAGMRYCMMLVSMESQATQNAIKY